MVSVYDIKKYLNDHPELGIVVDGDNVIIHTKNGEVTRPLEEFVVEYRKLDHCDFEHIFSDRASLLEIIRCRQCGTVIFTYNDERYDERLKCPTCGKYETSFKFYTKEEIESDPEKQKEIDFYIDWHKEQVEQSKRWLRRGKKYDWQLGKKTIKFKNRGIRIELECDNVCESYVKGLRLNIHILNRDKNSCGWIWGKQIRIPLSISNLKSEIRYKKYKKQQEKESNNG